MANPANFTITECGANGAINQPAAQTVDTDGIVPIEAGGDTGRLILEVDNGAAAACTVTIKAGVNPPALQSRDLAVSLAATGSAGEAKVIGPLESSRFVQEDGSIDIEFEAASGSPSVAVRVLRLSKYA